MWGPAVRLPQIFAAGLRGDCELEQSVGRGLPSMNSQPEGHARNENLSYQSHSLSDLNSDLYVVPIRFARAGDTQTSQTRQSQTQVPA